MLHTPDTFLSYRLVLHTPFSYRLVFHTPLSYRLVFHAPLSYRLVFHTPLSYRLVCHTLLSSLILQLYVMFWTILFNVISHSFHLTVLCNGSDHAFQKLIHGDDVEKMECEEIAIKNRPQDGKYN